MPESTRLTNESLLTERETEATASAPEISLLDILVILARRKRSILYAVLGFAVAGVIVALLWPVTYTAITTILPPQQPASASSALLSQLGGLSSLASLGGGGGGGPLNLKNPSDLYVGLLKSQTVEDAMVKRYDLLRQYHLTLVSDGRKALEGHSVVDGSGKDGLIRISYRDPNPARAAELANGYVEQYRKLSATLAIGEASQRRVFLEQQMEQIKERLANSEESLKRTQQTTGLIQMDSQARALIESAGSLRAQVAAKEVQVQSMRSYAAEGNTDLIQAEQELAGLRAQVAKLGGVGDGTTNDIVVPKGRISEAGLEYVRKLRDVKANETLFEILARQYAAARLDEAREGALIQVVDRATPPDRKSSTSRRLIVEVATVLGLILGVFWVLFQEAVLYLESIPEYSVRISALREALVWRRPAMRKSNPKNA